jgi:lipopolysaccharide transport system permease protein
MVPEGMRWMIELNPLAWAAQAARSVLLNGVAAPWDGWSLHLVASCIFAILGWAFFRRVKSGFADVL